MAEPTHTSGAILYSCVSRGNIILSDFQVKQFPYEEKNFNKVVLRILEQIPANDGKLSYSFEKHYFHYDVSDGITYLCMAPEEFGRRIPFSYLEDIKARFKSTYGSRGKDAVAYAMQADFSRVLQKQMDYFSNDSNADKIRQLRSNLDEVKGIMVDSIEKVLERGESIELLLGRTENLTSTAVNFKRKSEELKNALIWRNVKISLAIAFVVLVIILIIIAISCGGVTWPKCVPSGSPTPPPTPPPSTQAPHPTAPPV